MTLFITLFLSSFSLMLNTLNKTSCESKFGHKAFQFINRQSASNNQNKKISPFISKCTGFIHSKSDQEIVYQSGFIKSRSFHMKLKGSLHD